MRMWVLVAVAMLGCDDGGDSGTGLAPEDYLPEGASLDGLTEGERLCVLHRQVAIARAVECDPLGPLDMLPAPTEPGEVLEVSLRVCLGHTMADYTPPSVGEHVARCLNYRASAPCADLVAEVGDNAHPFCELASPSW